ncbi:MAG TPA: hypothetical protein VLK89_08125 [Solirubrobacterales bacterium]|nr:hypothetical protein [Solirubrobacterales bacterium]
MPNKPRLTYANVVSTLALFLALGGSAAYAAGKIQSGDLAAGAVHTSNVFKRAVTSGKLALGAVRSNQIANGAVGSQQIGDGAVSSKQIEDGAVGSKQIEDRAVSSKQIEDGTIGSQQIGDSAVAPSNLEFPVFYAASPSGGSVPVTEGPDSYPLDDDTWTQNPGEIEVVFGGAAATVAYDGSGSGSCRVFFEVNLNGQQVGGGEISNGSTNPEQIEQTIGAQPQIDPTDPVTNHLSVQTSSNGDCTPDSTIDSTRFRVLDFG